MEDIILKTSSVESVIHCGKGAFKTYAPQINGKLFVVTDTNVFELYGDLIKKTFVAAAIFVLPAGERSKNQNHLMEIFNRMIFSGLTRKSTVIAFGGGVVGDIAGLAASMYMRGINVVQIPTTLLSQVDSSVGGKTAIDFKGVKNAIGSFYQPSQVIVDPMFLKTLPARELRCGLGEIIKYGALDKKIYHTLIRNEARLFDIDFLESVICDCIRHKAKIVMKDEKDVLGLRKTLNLGHTTGHAFELFYKRKSHGEFVLIGMYYELAIAEGAGVCEKIYADSLRRLIKKVLKVIPAYEDMREAAMMARFDKKNEEQSFVALVVPANVGQSVELVLPIDEYADEIEACAKELTAKK